MQADTALGMVAVRLAAVEGTEREGVRQLGEALRALAGELVELADQVEAGREADLRPARARWAQVERLAAETSVRREVLSLFGQASLAESLEDAHRAFDSRHRAALDAVRAAGAAPPESDAGSEG